MAEDPPIDFPEFEAILRKSVADNAADLLKRMKAAGEKPDLGFHNAQMEFNEARIQFALGHFRASHAPGAKAVDVIAGAGIAIGMTMAAMMRHLTDKEQQILMHWVNRATLDGLAITAPPEDGETVN